MTEGIPTVYKGHRMRSRLEARWAAFFDRARWPWTYEPLDLPGWVPDFAVLRDPPLIEELPAAPPALDGGQRVTLHDPILVEVKPALNLAALAPHAKRIEGSGTTFAVLLVGALLPLGNVPSLGLLKEALRPWILAPLEWCDGPCGGRLTVRRLGGDHRCLLCGTDLRRLCSPDAVSRAARYWAEAGNDTRWRA